MNIGIYGGSFNPIHYGHLLLAQSAGEEYNLDKILFVVSVNPPHKDKSFMPSFEHRFNMVNLAIKDKANFESSDIEKEIEGKSYTFYVIQKLKEKYGKDNNFFLIMGQDEANYFTNWFKYNEIMKMCKIIVGRRVNDLPPNNLNFEYIDMPCIEISSSDLRNKIRNNKSIMYYTEKSVIDYIKDRKIYLENEN